MFVTGLSQHLYFISSDKNVFFFLVLEEYISQGKFMPYFWAEIGRAESPTVSPVSYLQLKIINMPKQQILGRHVLNRFICVLDQAEERIEFSQTGTGYTISISHTQKMQLFQEKTKKNCLRKKM